jgi:hypothetical protein
MFSLLEIEGREHEEERKLVRGDRSSLRRRRSTKGRKGRTKRGKQGCEEAGKRENKRKKGQ